MSEPKFQYHIRAVERLEVREGDETELVSWPLAVVRYFHAKGCAGWIETATDGDELVAAIDRTERHGYVCE